MPKEHEVLSKCSPALSRFLRRSEVYMISFQIEPAVWMFRRWSIAHPQRPLAGQQYDGGQRLQIRRQVRRRRIGERQCCIRMVTDRGRTPPWGSVTPPSYVAGNTDYGSSIQFFVKTASTQAGLGNASLPESLISTAQAWQLPNTEVGGADISSLNISSTATPWMRVRARLNPGYNGDKPILTDWQLVYSCPPAE